MALLLRRRTRTHDLTNLSPLHHRLLSTSNSGGADDPNSNNSPFSSYFREVRENLKQRSPSPSPSNPPSSTFSSPSSSSPKKSSLDEIIKNLSEFRRRTSAPPDNPSSQPQQISFQEIYKRNVKPPRTDGSANSVPEKPGGQISLDAIRESIGKLGEDKLKPKPVVNPRTSVLSDSLFAREGNGRVDPSIAMNFARSYSHEDLGKKLKALRPEAKGKEWFSLGELKERLVKLREIEVNESKSSGMMTSVIRDALLKMDNNEDKTKKASR